MQIKLLKTILKSFIGIVLLFVIIYPLKFVFCPYVTTRMFLGLIGLPFLCKKNNFNKLRLRGMNIMLSFALIMLVSLFTLAINGTTDLFFLTYPFAIIIILSATCLWCSYLRRICTSITVETISKYVVIVFDIQMIIVVLFFIYPELREWMNSFLVEEYQHLTEGTDLGFRVYGFGSGFAGSGIVNSFALQIAMYNICNTNTQHRRFFIISFLTILIIGSMMSRTTTLGGLLALAYFLYQGRKSYINMIKKILKFIVGVLIFFLIFSNLGIKLTDDLEQQMHFGFEMFYNYSESGKMETNSTDDLLSSYKKVPTEISTWLVGDGFFDLPNGRHYMDVDNGYQRMIYFFGIFGMMMCFLYNIYIYRVTSLILGDKSLPLLFLLLYFIINSKGDVLQIATFYGLYMFMCRQQKVSRY